MRYNSLFEEVRKELGDSPINQYLLVQCERKWQRFGDKLDFNDKSVLDIGCTEGHSCVEAVTRGAVRCLGVEKFPQYLPVGFEVIKRLKMGDKIRLLSGIWEEIPLWHMGDIEMPFDIVLALGFLHHIDPKDYKHSIRKMCDSCSQVIVLENRVDAHATEDVYLRFEYRVDDNGNRVPVTVPSEAWLRKVLENYNFFVSDRMVINEGEREIWIVKRGNVT